MKPIQARSKKNEGFVYRNILDKRGKVSPKFQVNDLARVAELKKMFSKGDTINWCYKLYKIIEYINDTIPIIKSTKYQKDKMNRY